jgi:hypothetical protein
MEVKRIPLIIILISFIAALFECETDSKGNRYTLRNTVSYSNRGTRSEARHGHLFLNEREIPDVYRLVICSDRAFGFFQRRHMWGRDGYFPVKLGEDGGIVKSSTGTGSDAIERGYYRGNVRYGNTPEDWMFVKWDGGAAFVSPERITDLDRALQLKIIPRHIRDADYEEVPLKMDRFKKRDR